MIALAAWTTSGCSLLPERTVYVTPDCSAPPLPAPPEVPAEDLTALSDDTYWTLRERDDTLIDAVLLRQRMLEALCGEG